ncbi:metalloprotease PmbA [Candidatus Photodesmus anomalopis]|uniref:metalloprotease PmbA n=1 Tax=Candidatus Photodesmus anomalopis TaxID=28176 RepID=UPI0003FC955B|nr:metalloprotease PmbA [Candidatus Photodesmus katoptron]
MDLEQQITQQRIELELIALKALKIASITANACEVTITKSTGLSVSSLMCAVENIEFMNDSILKVTVYKGKRKGSASTSELSMKAIQMTIAAALDIAQYTSEDLYSGLASKELMVQNIPELDLFCPDILDPNSASKIAITAEKKALSYNDKIKQSNGANFDVCYGIKVYGNSYDLIASYLFSQYQMSCSIIAQGENSEMECDYGYSIARHKSDLLAPEIVGREAAFKAVNRLGAKKLITGTYPVMFSADIASGLIAHLARAISGESLHRKSSFLLGYLGKQIFPKWFNISEDPHVLRGLGSKPFDNEGLYTKNCQIISNGILMTYLLSSYSARKMNMIETGHTAGIHNWFIQCINKKKKSQMLTELDTGLLVTEVIGQGVNIVTGNYSRGAVGFWVKNGQVEHPVSEITIASNLKDMFRNIVAIGNDVDTRSKIQTGSILVESMKIAGN